MHVRFIERTMYDINRDGDVHMFMATLSNGSFYSYVPDEGVISLRDKRNEFKAKVIQAIQAGDKPGELELGA